MLRNLLRAPGARALAALALLLGGFSSSATALPLISEVLYDATGSDLGRVFVELYGAPGTSLAGLFLEGVNGANGAVAPVLALSGQIPDDGFFVIASDPGDGITLVAEADLVLAFDFQNGPDSIVLRSGETVLDALGYGDFAPEEVFSGEGAAAPDAPAGSSLARRFANADSDDNFSDFVVQGAPTPGSAPLLPVPEPGTAALVASGLLGLGGARRRARRHC